MCRMLLVTIHKVVPSHESVMLSGNRNFIEREMLSLSGINLANQR